MKTYSENTENTLIAFHIGRGGRFNNAGHRVFCDQDKSIESFTNDLFINFEDQNDFKNRFGWDSTGNSDQKCILDLLTDENFEELELRFGISESDLGEKIYTDGSGNAVGLTVEEAHTGVGRIEEDGEYDTTYVCLLSECDESECSLIIESDRYHSVDVDAYIFEKFPELKPEEEEDNG